MPADAALVDLVEALRALPYGRPSERTVAGMLAEGRGTCSTKHAHLVTELEGSFPETEPVVVHRVYRVTRAQCAERFGPGAAAVVPEGGLVDVHRYVEATVSGQRIVLDVTFPGAPWDGSSSLPLACGSGDDLPVPAARTPTPSEATAAQATATAYGQRSVAVTRAPASAARIASAPLPVPARRALDGRGRPHDAARTRSAVSLPGR